MASLIFAVQQVLHQLGVNIYEKGQNDTTDYRVHAKVSNDKEVSLWHDIPLFPTIESEKNHICNMVNEIPRFTRKKFEIATNEPGNPIKQDIKKGKLREFSKGDLYFNYGCLPRTWEDPDYEHPDAKAKGDNDPLDICEIGMKRLNVGEICSIKVLGCLCLIDEGEADWKIIGISITDPWALYLNDIDDVERLLPGVISSIREWFRTYKIPDGKPENKFGLEGKCMNAAYAMDIIKETHESWLKLVLGHKDDNSNTSNDDSPIESKSKSQKVRASDLPNVSCGLVKALSYPRLSHEDIISIEPYSPTHSHKGSINLNNGDIEEKGQ